MSKTTLALFDFDGTITTKDTFAPYLVRVFGWTRVKIAFASLGMNALMVAGGFSTRDRFKERLLEQLFTDADYGRLETAGTEHAGHVVRWYRPGALERIIWHRERGHRLIMVSASLDLYLLPVASSLGFDDLLCTEIERDGSRCTGRMKGRNCRAAEKVWRVERLLGRPLSDFEVYAYGDTAGDAEMLRRSDHPSFKPFQN
jgi:phosphatidylglycerophosphatase C